MKTPPFTARERQLGLRNLELMFSWSDWVHRRVETIQFETYDTYRRQISVDFTLPANSGELTLAGDDQEVYFTPLTLLKKRPLTNFDLRDEAGAAIPLLTKDRNASLAASLLAGLASLVAPPLLKEAHGSVPPPDIDLVFMKLALTEGDSGVDPVDELQPVEGMEEASCLWREQLLTDRRFLATARILTQNYLVIVPLCGPTGVRRILKLSYDEPPTRSDAWLQDAPAEGVFRKVLGWIVGEEIGPRPRSRPRPRRIRRSLGLMSDVRSISVPAASYGAGYHLEFVAPDGLNITRGDLIPIRNKKVARESIQTLRDSRRRAHLYLPRGTDLPFGASEAAAVVHLRPSSATLVRATALLSLFTTVLLVFVGFRWEGLVENIGVVPGLLLIVPAGLAALVARPGEASITTQLLLGIRSMAIFEGFCAFAAAALIVGGRSCEPGLLGENCKNWEATSLALLVLAGASAVVMCALFIAWYCSSHPPEQAQP